MSNVNLSHYIKKIIVQTLSYFALCFVIFSANANVDMKVDVSKPYARETIPGTQVSAAYMVLTNNSAQAISLISAKSSVSPRVELHQHTMADGMMKMRQVASILIPAQDTVELKPSGYHLMILDLEKRLINEEKITITLAFSNNQTIDVVVPVTRIKKKTHHHHH